MTRTLAPGTAAPCGSVTVPRIVPRNDWANAGPAVSANVNSSSSPLRAGRAPFAATNEDSRIGLLLGLSPITSPLGHAHVSNRK